MIRIPTDAEFADYYGEQCFAIWRRTQNDWRCPACDRTKRELLRWTRRNPRPRAGRSTHYMGWMAGLHTHHDHAANRNGFYRPALARFEETVICDQCNAADAVAKAQLKLPRDFSFSPSEISQFITPTAHGSHVSDYAIAYRIFRDLIGAIR